MNTDGVDRTPMTSEQCKEFKVRKSHYVKRSKNSKRGNRTKIRGEKSVFDDNFDGIDWSKK